MSDLWLVRHGETDWSRTGRHTGRTDMPLTALGVRQARLLSRRIASQPFSIVLTSPLQRALETCRLAGKGDVAIVDPDLCEWDYGVYEGRTTADIRRDVPAWTVWTHPIPKGEALAQVAVRAERVIALALAAEGDVAIFAHGHVLRVLAARWAGLAAADGRLFNLDTASLSRLGAEHELHVIRSWNERYDLLEVP